MHEIKIRIHGDGSVRTGFQDRLRLGVAHEVNRVRLAFELDPTIEGSYHYIKFYKDDISMIYRVHSNKIIVNKYIFSNPGVWLFSFISTDDVIVNNELTGSYAFISEPTEAVVLEGILKNGETPEEIKLLTDIFTMDFTELVIPDYITKIGDYFMYETKKTFSVRIPANVELIGGHCFYHGTITNLLFDKNSRLETLSENSFYIVYFQCGVVLPASLKTWGKHCFRYSSIQKVEFEKGSKLSSLGSYAFWDTEATEFYCPDNLHSLGDRTYVFANNKNLRYIWIPNTLTTSIPANFVYNCPSLTEIELQSDFNISANFSNCTALSSDAIVRMFNALKNLNNESAKSITLGAENLAKLTEEQITIATSKNWTVS